MTNFFSIDSTYRLDPIFKQIDSKTVDRDIENIRCKTLEAIKEIIDQKELSRSELAMAARICQGTAGKVYRGNIDKISTERLLRISRKLGLKAKIKFVAD